MVPMNAKDVLKSALMVLGAQSVMTFGTLLMHKLYATSWDMQEKVMSFSM